LPVGSVRIGAERDAVAHPRRQVEVFDHNRRELYRPVTAEGGRQMLGADPGVLPLPWLHS
jgi:hypothetical protein